MYEGLEVLEEGIFSIRAHVKKRDVKFKSLRGIDAPFIVKENGTKYFIDRIWVPYYGSLRKLVINEAHKTRYSKHPGSDKMYQDLKELYW